MDYKKCLTLDTQRVIDALSDEMILGKISSFLDSDKEERQRGVKFFSFDNSRFALQNFLIYKIAGCYDLYGTEIDDADVTFEALKYLKEQLYSTDEVSCVHVGVEKRRAFLVGLKNGKEIYLESDTGNSLMGDLGIFMRKIIPEYKRVSDKAWPGNTYIREFGLHNEDELINKYGFSKRKKDIYYMAYKLFYYYMLIPELDQNLRGVERECFLELEKRAAWVHTSKNMMLVPYGYNAKRGYSLKIYKTGQKIDDRLDYTYFDLEKMQKDETFSDKDLQDRLRNNKCTKESIHFLLANQKLLMPPRPVGCGGNEKTIEAVNERSKAINKSIDRK